jgi:acetylornithine aminotransferase
MPISAAAIATIKLHLQEKVWLQAVKSGQFLLALLKDGLETTGLAQVWGLGMEIGVTINKPKSADKAVRLAHQRGLFVTSDHAAHLQIMPPLTMSKENLSKGAQILAEVVKEI